MTSKEKWATWIIVIVIVAGGLWYWAAHRSGMPQSQPSQESNPSGVPASAGPTSILPTSPTDTSDAALQQDAAAIDTQMNGLSSDLTTADQGLNAQQAPIQ